MMKRTFILTLVLTAILLIPVSVTYAYVGTANVTDASVSDSRVDPSDSVTWTVGPVYNGSSANPVQNGWGMEFDGSGDYIQTSAFDLTNNNTGTIEGWFYTLDNNQDLFGWRKPAGYDDYSNFAIRADGTIRFYWDEGPIERAITSTDTVDDGSWHQVVVVQDGTTVTMYIDTLAQADTETTNMWWQNMTFSTQSVFLGDAFNSGSDFNGTIDEFRLYTRALGTGEIAYSYENKVPLNQNNLECWIDFDQQVLDQTPNGNDGTKNGDPVYVRGVRGKAALTLDGTSDYIDCGNDASLQNLVNFTAIGWIKPIGVGPTWDYLVEKNFNRVFQIRQGTPNIQGDVSTSLIHAKSTGTTVLQNGQLYHMAMSFNNVTDRYIRLYLDSVEETYSTYTQGTGSLDDDSGKNLYLASFQGTTHWFNGSLDEMMIYNRTLSLSEIQENYQGIISQNGLVLYLDFDGQVQDHSGEGNNGVVNGDPEYSSGWASCPVSTSYNGTGGTTVSLVNSTTGLCTIPDTAPATVANYTVTATVPAASANATYLGFIVDSYHVNVYSIYDITEEDFNTLLYADGESLVDGHQLTNGDSITIEGIVFSWNTYTSRFEATDSESTPQTKTYDTLTSLNEATYGITSGSMNITATVTWTQGTLDRIQTDFTTGDWVSAIIGEYTYAMGELFFWTTLMTILSIGIYNVWGAYPTILAWILGWGVFTDVIHAQAQIIGYIFILFAVALAIVKLALDRRTT